METAPLSYNLHSVVHPCQSKMNVSVILSKGDCSDLNRCTMYTYSITGNVKKNVVEVLPHLEDVSRSAASPLTGDKSCLTIIMQNVSLFEKF